MEQDGFELILDTQNKATIHLHGATVTSWISSGEEVLFLSNKSIFDKKKAIRGGIPIVFPNFGPWDMGPQHGFARIKRWSIKEPAQKYDNDSISVVLSLRDDAETHKFWNYSFELLYRITLFKHKFITDLTVINTGMDSCHFTLLLHTYFRCDDISNVEISDLHGCEYSDKVNDGCIESETNKILKIEENVDRVYQQTPSVLKCIVNKSGKTIEIVKENLPDTVVWNPWSEKAKAMSDFGDEEYKQMVCVEPGFVANRFILKPKSMITFKQELRVISQSLDINIAKPVQSVQAAPSPEPKVAAVETKEPESKEKQDNLASEESKQELASKAVQEKPVVSEAAEEQEEKPKDTETSKEQEKKSETSETKEEKQTESTKTSEET